MNDFLGFDSWFAKEFKELGVLRFPTLKIALNLLYQRTSNPLIVETGTVRQLDDWGAGYSTFVFGKYLQKLGSGKLITIDIEPDNIKVCKTITEPFKEYIEYVVQDSLFALGRMTDQIDLLYLDSLDTPIEDDADATPAQEHCLKEFQTAEPLLHNGSILLADDNDLKNGGKTRLLKEYLKEKGWILILDARQTVWMR